MKPKLKIKKLPEPEMLEKHVKMPKAANGRYSLYKASYNDENNTITLYKHSLEDSFVDDHQYDGINQFLKSFDQDSELSINHEMHHKHNNEAQIDEFNFAPMYNYQITLSNEMSSMVINYKSNLEGYNAPQGFKDFYLLFSVSFNIIENYIQYANQFIHFAFKKENKGKIISLSEQEILYNQIIDWYFTYDFGTLIK